MSDEKSQPGIQPSLPAAPPNLNPDAITSYPQTKPQVAPTAAAGRTAIAPKGPRPGDMKDGTREVIETIVFVVVLVLLLKTFLAEAFVIPTGSMATTLLGYQQELVCDMCGYRFLVNASSEAEDRPKQYVTKGYCPNCRYLNVLRRQLPDGEVP
jgi:signal peptidase I